MNTNQTSAQTVLRTAKELAARYGHRDERSSTILKTGDYGHGNTYDLSVYGVGDAAYFEEMTEYGDSLGESFNVLAIADEDLPDVAPVFSHQFSLPLNDAQKTVLSMISGLKYQHLINEQHVGAFNQAVQGSNDALLQYLLTELSDHKDQGSKLSPSQRISVAMMEMKYVLDKLIAQHDQKDLRGHAGVAFQTAAIEPPDQNSLRKKLIGDLLDYAERFADMNDEPEDGQCRQTIRKAQAWFETGSASVDPDAVKEELIEYVERYADENNEPEDGDCRRLLLAAKPPDSTEALPRERG